MANNTIKTRIQLKNDTEANWNKAINFIPLKGEVIIYSADDTHPFSRLKVGDGNTTVINLPFINTGNLNENRIFVDTTINWQTKPNFIPNTGDIIIFLDKEILTKDNQIITIPGIKIGDGDAYNLDLPFIGDEILDQLLDHIFNSSIHTTSVEKTFWNNKLNCEDVVVRGTLILNRN